MIINGKSLLEAAPIKDMLTTKVREHGVSYGLSEAGYDIRLKQDITFLKPQNSDWVVTAKWDEDGVQHGYFSEGRFTIASAIEEFQMPDNLVGIVHDKSTWARCGLSVFNTVIEPGWKGFLTLELVYNGNQHLYLPAGCGIAQVVFTRTSDPMNYSGKYQGQGNHPVNAVFERS